MNRAGGRCAAGAVALALLFSLAAAYHIDRPGLHADELLFVQGVWERGAVESFTRVFGSRVPLMQMPYLGALKSILYQPVFALAGVSAAAVRLPMVLAGGVTVALTFLLLWRLAGERAAWLGGGLLAVDPTFLFTTRCDWGPVALERLLAVGGVVLFSYGRFSWGALLFGLALWNKTTFVWTLGGLAVAMLVCYRAQLRIPLRTLVVALLCFAAGAYPWIRYNVNSKGGTMQATARFDSSDLAGKARVLQYSLEGSALYGYLMRDDGQAGPWPRANITPWLLCAGILAAAARRDRLALFFVLVTAIAWLAMALTKDAGGSSHHVVLLWPWPHCVVALAAARWRVFTVAAVLGMLMSAGVVIRHYSLIDRLGSDTPWSEAIYPLAARVEAERPAGVFVIDWGIGDQLLLASRGQMPLEIAAFRDLPPAEFAARRGWIFVGHVLAREALKGANEPWKQVPGFRRVSIATIRDRQEVEVFELFRFETK